MSEQQQTAMGWTVFLAMLGVILAQLGSEVVELDSWATAMRPPFIGKALVHVGTVVGAFWGGKKIPTGR